MIFFKQVDYFLAFRFFACLLVIRQHVAFIQPQIPFGWVLGGNPGSGGFAVITFVLLSGYLMTKIFLIGKYKFGIRGIMQFYWSRIKRIAPVYYFLLVFLIWFLYPYIVTPDQFDMYKGYLAQLLYFDYYGGLPYFNQVIWAISLEVQLYFITPILLFFLLKIKNLLWSILLLPISIYLVVNPVIFQFGRYQLWQFLPIYFCGSITALIVHYIKLRKLKFNSLIRTLSLLIALLVIMFPWHDSFNIFKTLNRSAELFISLGMIVFLMGIELTGGSRLDLSKQSSKFAGILNYLGKLSYIIFLSHMIFLVHINDIYGKYIFTKIKSGIISGIIIWGLTSVLTIIFSMFIYHTVEISGIIILEKLKNKLYGKSKLK